MNHNSFPSVEQSPAQQDDGDATEFSSFEDHMKHERLYQDDEFANEEIKERYYDGGKEDMEELKEHGVDSVNLYSHDNTAIFKNADSYISKTKFDFLEATRIIAPDHKNPTIFSGERLAREEIAERIGKTDFDYDYGYISDREKYYTDEEFELNYSKNEDGSYSSKIEYKIIPCTDERFESQLSERPMITDFNSIMSQNTLEIFDKKDAYFIAEVHPSDPEKICNRTVDWGKKYIEKLYEPLAG